MIGWKHETPESSGRRTVFHENRLIWRWFAVGGNGGGDRHRRKRFVDVVTPRRVEKDPPIRSNEEDVLVAYNSDLLQPNFAALPRIVHPDERRLLSDVRQILAGDLLRTVREHGSQRCLGSRADPLEGRSGILGRVKFTHYHRD